MSDTDWIRWHDDYRDAGIGAGAAFVAEGFEELAFVAPADARFRVGMCRLTIAPPDQSEGRLFTFR